MLGGHDWGGTIAYRAAQWYPELISHVFSVAMPYYNSEFDTFVTAEEMSATWPNFGYQLQWGSAEKIIENTFSDEVILRKFLTGMYGGP